MYLWVATAAVYLFLTLNAQAGIPVTDDMKLKGEDGQTYAIVVDCPQEGSTKKGIVFGGSEDSMVGKARCGQCLINANYGAKLIYPFDLHIKGVLVDENGAPLKGKMLQFHFPIGWTVKTRTSDTGYFRILMGATAERKSDAMLEKDLGKLHMKKDSKMPFYALYVLPPDFRPCEDILNKK